LFEAKVFFAWLATPGVDSLKGFLDQDDASLRAQALLASNTRVIAWDSGSSSDPNDADDGRLTNLLTRLPARYDKNLLATSGTTPIKDLVDAASLSSALPSDFFTRFYTKGSQSDEDFWNSYVGTANANTVASFRFASEVYGLIGFLPFVRTVALARKS